MKNTQDEYIEEDYQPSGSRVPKWALISGVVLVFLCLAVLFTLFLARTKILEFAVGALATDTPVPTETLPPTETSIPQPTDTLAPTEGPPEIPTATPIPMPPSSISSIAQGGPVLDENFADNSRNWAGINDKSEVTIQENQLQLHSAEEGKPAVGLCLGDTCGPFKDYYYVQADMVEDRPSTLALGLVFGMNDQKTSFYSFAIKPSSAEYALYKVANGQWNPLIDWTSSPAVKFFPFVNIVGASYSAGTIQLFANGEQISAYQDKQTPLNSGRIGFSVETDGVRLLASNVKVLNLAPVAPQIPTGPGVTYQTPTPQARITATPTKWGACPPGVPEGKFVLMILRSVPKSTEILIDGKKTKIVTGQNIFYLSLGETHTINLGTKQVTMTYKTCMVRQISYNR